MKVLFLTPWYPDDVNPHHGVFIRDQAAAIAQHHSVVLVSSKVDYKHFGMLSFTSDQRNFQGVEEHRVVVQKSFPFYNQLNYLFLSVWYTRKLARRFRPDIIHGNIGYPSAFWSWIIGWFMNVPFVITEHSTRFDSNLRSPVHRFLTLGFIKKASAIISVSTSSAAAIFSFVKKEPVIIPNMIHVARFAAIEGPPPGGVCQIGFLGGLDVPRKGLDILIKAMAGSKRNFVLHIGGKGELLERYKEMATHLGVESKCIFYGFIADGEVPQFMGRLHFFVSASRAEGFGMVLAEALACGLPIVSTRSGGPVDFIVPENGILVPPENEPLLRQGVEWMMDHYETFDKAHLRAYVASRFSPETIAGRINEVYSRALAGDGTSR